MTPRTRTFRTGALALAAASSLALFAAQTAFAAPAPKVGDTLPSFTLNTPAGTPVALASLLKKGPVVLVVLRGYPGYQCPFCTRQVGELTSNSAEFAKHNAQILLVYPGPSDSLQQRANEFVQGKTIPANYTLVVDPGYTFLNKYSLRWDAPHETSYPSTFVLDKSGKVLFAKVSHEHGDRPSTAEVLKTLP